MKTSSILLSSTLVISALAAQPIFAADPVNIVTVEAKEDKVQMAANNIVTHLKKQMNKETPEVFQSLVKSMASNNDFSLKLTHAIGTLNQKEADLLLTEAVKEKMNVDFVDVGSDIVRFKLCANFNGVRHCFPSQRNSPTCPTF